MRILGICHDVFICSACLIEDGEIVFAAPEERFDRVKQSKVFPTMAMQACLDHAGIALTDIDEIAVAWNPAIELDTIQGGWLSARRSRVEHLHQVPGQLMRMAGGAPVHQLGMDGVFEGCPRVTYIDHYKAHWGNAAYLSPWDEAAVLILDGRAEKQTGLLGHFHGVEEQYLEEIDFPHSLGQFYGAITQLLGFRPDSDEWKVMALASMGRKEGNPFVEPMRTLITVDDETGRFELDLRYFAFFNYWERFMFTDAMIDTFGPPRAKDDPYDQRCYDVAAAMQIVFEDAVTRIATALHRRTGSDRLVVSGGCFMNSVYNGKIVDETPFEEVFISSAPDDSGTAVGAALYMHGVRTSKQPVTPANHNYWGPEFTDAECLAEAERYKLNHRVVDDPSGEAAEDLVAGRILGWFQGRMEFGQRALGGRSILLDPRREDGKDVVNAAVKYREAFRPFAPAILAERAHEWFDCEPGTQVPFMERVLMFRQEMREQVPAVVHFDGSGRLQTVDGDSNPRYRKLIERFDEITGVPIVLNTSFNLNGEPVVCSPRDAIRTFYSCGLDVLYLGNVRIEKAP